jgi:hypothetical protein
MSSRYCASPVACSQNLPPDQTQKKQEKQPRKILNPKCPHNCEQVVYVWFSHKWNFFEDYCEIPQQL